MPRVPRTLTGLALLAIMSGACSPAASDSPDGSLPVLVGRGGSPGVEPSPVAPSASPAATSPTGPITLLDQFPAAMATIGATCGPRSGMPEYPMIACVVTDSATGTQFAFDGFGRGDQFSSMTSGATVADGKQLDYALAARTFGAGLTAISGDAGHPGIAWIRDHLASAGDIGEGIGGYHFEVTRVPGSQQAVRLNTTVADGSDPVAPSSSPAATGPVTNLDEFSARFGAVPGITCGQASASSVGEVLRCQATDTASGTAYRISGYGGSDRLVTVFVRAIASAGRTIDDEQVANVFERTIALVSGDYTHPGMAWARTHVADIDSTIDLDGYRFEVYVPEEASDATQGRALMIGVSAP